MEKIILTAEQFKAYLEGCTVDYCGDYWDNEARLNDPENNQTVLMVNYDSENEDWDEELYVSDWQYFVPTDEQKQQLREKLDRETLSDRESLQESRNEPSDPYELYGVKRSDFI